MGSPMVFHTAPPHPASKARITCSPQLAGGAEASQNGLGLQMPPAKVVERSGPAALSMTRLEGTHDGDCSALPIRDRIHHLASSIDAIAARIILRTAAALQQGEWRLTDCWNHH